MTVRWHAFMATVGAITVLVGCSPEPPAAPAEHNRPPRTIEPGFDGATALPAPDLTDDGAGSLVKVEPTAQSFNFEKVDATAVRVVYRSTSSDGEPTEVSGAVVVPPGEPPRGGWPIISFGHGLTGVMNVCGPSLAEELAGYAAPIAVLVSRGYVVAASDYQGLGLRGYSHSVADTTTLGNNMIDVVRAARRVVPDTSTRWAAFGTGEGGAAAWAAAELAGEYGAGLDLVGAVALSPFADLSGLADVAMTGGLTREQYLLLVQVLQGLANFDAGFDLDLYRFGLARERWDVLTNCAPRDPEEIKRVTTRLRADHLRPRDEAAAASLREALAGGALPLSSAPAAPILVIYGTEDPLVPPLWTRQASSEACAKGDSIEIMERIGDESANTDIGIQTSLSWLQSRFDGVRVANVCLGES
jgi:alpha-beta hydrolase superfamily lysophospholipase